MGSQNIPLDGVCPEHLKESASFYRAQLIVLLFRAEIRKTRKRVDAGMVNLTRSLLPLISVFRGGSDEGAFRVSVLVAAIGARQLPVDVNNHSRLGSARARSVARKNAGAGRCNHARLGGGEEAKRNADVPVLRLKPDRFPRQSV
jgi:hypothetical protein